MTNPDPWIASLDCATPAKLVKAALRSLQRPIEELLLVGADDRQVPVNGRNRYGFPIADLTPHFRGSSCTTTPPDAIALGDAARWRDDLVETINAAGSFPSTDALRAPAVAGILDLLGLSQRHEANVVLTPSGTDSELFMTALSLGGHERRLRNILVGSAEAGSGTKCAASGRAFSQRTPFAACVELNSAIDGLAVDRVSVVDIELRDHRGRARRPFDVEAEIEAHVEHALESGERVLVHAMAGSKTGICQISPAWVQTWRSRYPEALRVVVDAAQVRISNSELRAYLRAGASVSLTGSKSLSAAPFCGALILDTASLEDARNLVEGGEHLAQGLRNYFSAADLPIGLVGLIRDLEPVDLGLLARWAVARAETRRRLLVPAIDREDLTIRLHDELVLGLDTIPGVCVFPTSSPSIVAFSLLNARSEIMGKDALRDAYSTLVAEPGVHIGQPVELVPHGPAVLRFAIGSATITRGYETPGDAALDGARLAREALEVLGPLCRDVVLV